MSALASHITASTAPNAARHSSWQLIGFASTSSPARERVVSPRRQVLAVSRSQLGLIR